MYFITRIFCLTALFAACGTMCRAQQNDKKYDALWQKANELYMKKGLTQNALKVVENIYSMAKKENQPSQVIKALIYQCYLQEATEEDALLHSINRLTKESAVTKQPALSVLNSLLAEKYLQYFRQHSWELYDRTQTTGAVQQNIATWGVRDFHQKISTLYEASLFDEKLLQQTMLTPFDAIIKKGNVRYLRPTLYDFLAHRALDYFKSDERDVTQPAYAFAITGEQYFADAASFAAMRIVSNDSASLHHKALRIYQQLLAFHAKDSRPDALIDADLMRIEFVRQYGVMENKEALYAKALEQITATYADEPAAAQAWYLLAQWYAGKAAQYHPLKDTANRFAYREARAICEKVIRQKDPGEGKSNCINLLHEIDRQQLTMETEKVNVPGQPFRTLVSYRNLNRLNLRIIPLNDNLKKQLSNRFDDTYWKQLTALTPIRSWLQPFTATNDYQQHSAEIKIDALPMGEYMLLGSINENFVTGNNLMAVQYFHVSDISYINNNTNEYFIVHRETGRPLAKAAIQVWLDQYEYQDRRNVIKKAEHGVSDANGYYKMAAQKRAGSTKLEITWNNDRLFLDDNTYSVYTSQIDDATAADETAKARVFFFTDRSIYRPGQTLYFKGIALTRNAVAKNTKVLAGYKTVVKLYNANNEVADSVTVTTNAFGSYAGTFTLPENVLNGEFRLADDKLDGEVNFSVEAYKRPTFYVQYDTIKGSYKLNDSVAITGFAKAYAGNNINGAAIRYRVVRQPRFIYPWLYWKWGIPRSRPTEIANGTTITGDEGQFTIHFKAIPDLTISKQLDPIFDYQVIADITDINGETRSGESVVRVGYKAIVLTVVGVPLAGTLTLDSLSKLYISTTNLNGAFEPASVQVAIYPLQSPGRLIRNRYWAQPDEYTMSREDYLKQFPYDDYANEADYHSWNRLEKVYEATDSTRNGMPFNLHNTRFKEGWYAIEAVTHDRYSEVVTDVQYVQVYDQKQHTPPSNEFAWSAQQNSVIEPGGQSTITIGSAASDVYVIQQLQVHSEDKLNENATETDSSRYAFIYLNHEKKQLVFPVHENDRGGFGVNFYFVKNNRFFILTNQVIVPWADKALNISYETFRDKTLPGSEEKWKMKISGYKKDKVAAEMLLSMYDASLDQFRLHTWEVPDIWPTFNNTTSWNGSNCFASIRSQERNWDNFRNEYAQKMYDRLIEPGGGGKSIRILGYNSRTGINKDGKLQEVAEQMAPVDDAGIGVLSSIPAPAVASAKFTLPKIVKDEEAKAQQNSGPAAVPLRKNFNETAFFFPQLQTDADGAITFSFTLPEALTTWKLQAMAHTTDGAFGYSTKNVITQKQLMVQPNVPRFLREGDRLELSTKIANLTGHELTGTVHLELLDVVTLKPIDGWFQNMTANQYFTAEAGKSVAAAFSIQVPYQYNSAVVYRFVAKSTLPSTDSTHKTHSKSGSDMISDGEEALLPVITNSMLVTESMPLPVRGIGVKHFRFEKLLQSGASETLQQHALTVEFTTNPAWYAVQSLPYLNEQVYPCSEQLFNSFYANALASKIANASPRLQAVFNQWLSSSNHARDNNTDSTTGEVFRSSLQKNPELKTVLLQETPWVLEAKTEAQQQRNIALLFDMAGMSRHLAASLDKWKQLQSPNGGFVWFKGGPDDRYMTQYIVTGIGRLKKLGALPASVATQVNGITAKAIAYLDDRVKEDYERLVKTKSDLTKNNIGSLEIQYLYLRSFFPEYGIPGASLKAVTFYRKQAQQFWLQQNKYMQGMIALALHRTGDEQTATNILASLQQNAIVNEETGMYWKEVHSGYYWHQAPVETQSLLIEAFSDIGNHKKIVDDLRTWLLKQKQTHHWPTTTATANACYALLLQGTDWTSAEPTVDITLGDKTIKSSNESRDAGTGYFKKTIDGPFVQPAMGSVTVKVTDRVTVKVTPTGTTWGAVYWQYFENLDRITPAASPLKLAKQLFVERNSDKGPVLEPVNEGSTLKVGDKIKVRVTLSSDRDMEYVHLKDMRAGCMEPVNILSGYKWQGGIGYYETTQDVSTSFFFDRLPRGTYVFEYPLFISHTGNFSNGVTSAQCLYAPEFSSHSEGIRISVE